MAPSFRFSEPCACSARHGYFASRGKTDPEAAAKEEIEQAIFSQEEMHEVPVECQTQFFKSENGVRLSVVTHITTNGLKFRKAADRSNDDVVISTAIFDENGNLLTGQQKTVFMKLRDITLSTLDRKGVSASGPVLISSLVLSSCAWSFAIPKARRWAP